MENMARNTRARRHCERLLQPAPYPIPSLLPSSGNEDISPDAAVPPQKKRDWLDTTCSVCMECPHNAVLLLCSSHDKGCRPYMCGTSYRHSNCLDQFKKAYIKETSLMEATGGTPSPPWAASEKPEASELACPLCRGQVKGWTVVEPARRYLNSKKRACMQEGCAFVGSYKELRKHVKSEHPFANPREVDPTVEQKWRTFEREQERQDVISTIRSSMPRAMVFGDYVIDFDSNSEDDEADEEVGDAADNHGGIGRSLVYFLMREGARIMTLRGDNGAAEAGEEDRDQILRPISTASLFDGGEQDLLIRQGPERQRRRGRRSRSRGRAVPDAS